MTKKRLQAFVLVWVALIVGIGGLYVHQVVSKDQSVQDQDWHTWAPNTDPDGDGFIVHYPHGEYPGFGGVKMGVGLDVGKGQFLCVKLETEEQDDDVYWDWQIQIWHDETTKASYDFGTGALCFGPFGLDTHIARAHLIGQGRGQVRIVPIWTVEDERIYLPNGGFGQE